MVLKRRWVLALGVRLLLGMLVGILAVAVGQSASAQDTNKKDANTQNANTQDPKKKAVGKGPGGDGRPSPAAESVKGTGKISEIAPNGVLHVLGPGGGDWWLQIQAKNKDLLYVAKAEVGWLQPGAYVRFSTKLDKRGKATDPITSAMVLSMRPEFPPGVVSEKAGSGLDTGGLFSDRDETASTKKAPPKKTKAEASGESTSYMVTGRITQIRDGKFTVQADALTITGEFSPNAKISVELNELRGNVGDEVEFEGTRLPGSEGARVQRLKVSASSPLKMEEKRRGRGAVTKKKESAETPTEKDPS